MKPYNCLRCGSDKIEIVSGDFDTPAFRCQCENEHGWDEWCDTKEEAIKCWNERPIPIFIPSPYCACADPLYDNTSYFCGMCGKEIAIKRRI